MPFLRRREADSYPLRRLAAQINNSDMLPLTVGINIVPRAFQIWQNATGLQIEIVSEISSIFSQDRTTQLQADY